MIPREEKEFLDGLRQLNETYRLGLAESCLHACARHFQVLVKWNRVMNLVGDLTVDTAIYRHYGESLFLAKQMQTAWTRAADFGSGAGFPGIGVGAALSSVRVDLLEIRQKRVAFLRESTRACPNIRVAAGAAEDYNLPLDVVIGRAVDIDSILRFANRRGTAALLLIGAADGARWSSDVNRDHRRCEIEEVPWRPGSVVMRVHPITAV